MTLPNPLTDKNMIVDNAENADRINSLITDIGHEIVNLTAPKNRGRVRYLLNRLTIGHMEIDKFEILTEVDAC